jgi:hypothetical protein
MSGMNTLHTLSYDIKICVILYIFVRLGMEVSCDIVLVMNLESEMFLTSPFQIMQRL